MLTPNPVSECIVLSAGRRREWRKIGGTAHGKPWGGARTPASEATGRATFQVSGTRALRKGTVSVRPQVRGHWVLAAGGLGRSGRVAGFISQK